ncbi:MAG: LPS export ABC transporter permease LptG [Candidatus Rokuibacteriota bacterium]
MKLPAVPVLDGYLLRELLPPFFFGGVLFTFFLLIDRLYQLTELVITKGVPFHLVAQLLAFMLPTFLAHTLPMALLVAVLLAGGRLAGDLEIIAFKAAGVSLVRLLRPIMAAALLVAAVTAALTLVVNPIANQEFQQQLFRILQSKAVSGLGERVFNPTFGDVVVYVQDVSASQVALHGLLVSDERDPRMSRIITAREGRLLPDEENRRLTLRLLNGAVNETDVVPGAGVTPAPGAPPARAGAPPLRYRYTNFSVYDMSLSVDSPLRAPGRMDKPEKDLGLRALRAKIDAFADEAPERRAYVVEWHKRFALPVAAVVFAIAAFPLAVRSHRGGRSVALLGSLVILVAYYVVSGALESAALKGRLPPLLALWLPNAAFLVAGLVSLVATAREWRPPSLPLFWRALQAVARVRPRRRAPGAGAHIVAGARKSTHILDRYLMREYVTFLGIGLAVAAALFVVIDLLERLDGFLREKPPFVYILEHFLYRLPQALHDSLPVVVLVATIFLFLALSRYHELTAMKAAGISLYRTSAPILVFGIAIAMASGLFQELLLPRLNELGEEVDRVKIKGQLPRHLRQRTRLWMRSSDTRFYRVELLSPGTSDMYGVTVLDVDKDFRLMSRIDARRAHWTGSGWELSEGAFRQIGPQGQVQTAPFTRTTVRLDEDISDFTHIQKTVDAMSYRELSEYIARLEATGFQVQKYLVELHSKLSFPLVNLIMVLVAIPFALQSPRAGRLFGIGLAIAILAGYLVVHYVAIAFARADLLPPVLAAWTANTIFLGLGASLFLRART